MKEFFKKLDIKSWLILVLLFLTLLFGYKWYFSGDDESKYKIEQLENENKELKLARDLNNEKINSLEVEIMNINQIISAKEDVISELDSLVIKLEGQVNEKKSELILLKKELIEKKKNIDELKKNPIKREGDDLFNSLSNKLNKNN